MWLTFKRALHISAALLGYLLWWAVQRRGWIARREHPADRLARVLESLGTTFVKVGQALVLRRDLLPEEFVIALQRLQDRVAQFPAAAARSEIEYGLGRPIDQLFEQFEDRPLAAASIAQVHRASLVGGASVIVKVRRPGIASTIEQDMRLLRVALRTAMLIMPMLRRFDPIAIVDEIHYNLRREMDFRIEARNGTRIRRAFEGWSEVMIPEIFQDLCVESVMVQELSGGRRLDDATLGPEWSRVADVLVDVYLHQFLVLGFFHADPHGGNLFYTESGRICFHDFGMVGFLNPSTRRDLAALMQSFVAQDAEWMLDACIAIGLLGGNVERSVFQGGVEEILRDYAHLPLREWSFAEALLRIAAIGHAHSLRIPRDLLLFMRAVFLLEDTVRTLNPEFDLMSGLLGKASKILMASVKPRRQSFVRLEHEALQSALELPGIAARWLSRVRTEGLSLQLQGDALRGMTEEIRSSTARLSLALVTLGLYIASSLLMQHSLAPQVWGVPLLALGGYGLALMFTVRIVRGGNART